MTAKSLLVLIAICTFPILVIAQTNRLTIEDASSVTGTIQSTSGTAFWVAQATSFNAGLRIDEGANTPRAFVNYKVGSDQRFRIEVFNSSNSQIEEVVTIRNGNLGIGVNNPSEKLTIDGRICSTAMRITATSCWADYVFSKDYNLLPLEKVEAFITENKHLPNTPTADEIEANGIDVGEITINQQEKIEELFLYIIEMDKEVKALKQRLNEVEKENTALKKGERK